MSVMMYTPPSLRHIMVTNYRSHITWCLVHSMSDSNPNIIDQSGYYRNFVIFIFRAVIAAVVGGGGGLKIADFLKMLFFVLNLKFTIPKFHFQCILILYLYYMNVAKTTNIVFTHEKMKEQIVIIKNRVLRLELIRT